MASTRIPNEEIEKYAKRALNRWIKRLFEVKPLKKSLPRDSQVVVDLTVCTSAKMKKLNLSYRGKDKTTDVLSFASHDFFWDQGLLGDLVICGPVVLDQAKQVGHSWKNEMDVLIVHGLLHLLHFDHELGEAQEKQMAKLESLVLGEKRGLIKRSI